MKMKIEVSCGDRVFSLETEACCEEHMLGNAMIVFDRHLSGKDIEKMTMWFTKKMIYLIEIGVIEISTLTARTELDTEQPKN